jgi:hypothetical protein
MIVGADSIKVGLHDLTTSDLAVLQGLSDVANRSLFDLKGGGGGYARIAYYRCQDECAKRNDQFHCRYLLSFYSLVACATHIVATESMAPTALE